jgi:hypothetical protein
MRRPFPGRQFFTALLILLCAPSLPRERHSGALAAALPSPGEVLQYRIEWRLIHAGNARLGWAAAKGTGSGSWRTDLNVESAGLVSALFKVDDNYSSLLNDHLCAESSLLTAREGLRYRETRITYDAGRRKADYVEKDLKRGSVVTSNEISIPACVHDVIGGLYQLRALRLGPGQSGDLPISDGKKSAYVRVEAQQREQVTTPAGVFQTVRYEAFLLNNVVYHRNGRVLIWLSDDERRLPVQIVVRLQFPIGAITLQLEKVEKT